MLYMEKEKFDYSKEYDEKIKPLIFKLRKQCYHAGIPMFVTCAVADDGNKTTYKSEMLSPRVTQKEVSQNYIADMVNILNGFTTIPPTEQVELDFDF